jgi:hypothetical protein
VASPCFGALQEAEIIDPSRERLVTHRHRLGHSDQRCDLVERGPERMANRFSGDFERVLGDEESRGRRRGRIVAEQRASHALEDPRVARKPAAGIEARREGADAIEGDAPVGGSHAEDPAEARRQAHRAAGRAAGDAPGRVYVHRRAVVRILAREAPGQFVGVGLADEMRARVEQPLNDRRRLRRGPVGAQPVGAAEAGPVACDVVDVLDRELEPHEWPVRRALDLDVGMAAEGSEPVVGNDLVH